jgi:YidC/Oxa1 family membrane protein insertase
MNKQDISIVVVLAVLLLGWLFYQNRVTQQRIAAVRERAAAAATNTTAVALSPDAQNSAAFLQATNTATSVPAAPAAAPAPVVSADEPATDVPEQTAVLTNDKMMLTFSSKGGTLRDATLLDYRSTVERGSKPVVLDFAPSPALAYKDIPGFGANADYTLVSTDGETTVTLACRNESGLTLERRISILPDYRIAVRDRIVNAGDTPHPLPACGISLGAVHRGLSKNDTLGVDTLAAQRDEGGRLGKVRHWDTKLNKLFTGGKGGGGCGGAPSADGLPLVATTHVGEPQEWVALKSRFFVQAFTSDATNAGYRVDVTRLDGAGPLTLQHVAAQIRFPAAIIGAAGATLERNYTLYVGPKKLALLQRYAPRSAEIMQFGTFKWMCVLLVPTLNFFYGLIPNYGIAIILLTLLVRIVFWPLTHKSTESMKRMQAIQPKLKEIQAQFKTEPQKLQQETWKIYREHKVNPLSSCLPMLVQIPVFIALFTVLRSAVELRFAPFLWIADLSEPENLLAGVLPLVPALNILPFFMAGTMLLQSKLTPAMGDPAQQKMMMWMMPGMMLFMFYTMPSALVLYWTVSQVLAIAQLLWQKKKSAAAPTDFTAPPAAGSEGGEPLTRQARRRLAR